MCTQEALGYVTRLFNEGKLGGKVLDIGALDINGSARNCIKAESYTGIDIRPGRSVDLIASSHSLPFQDQTFDTVVCLEMLEHDSDPFRTMQEIFRVLVPGGWTLITSCFYGFPKHNEPYDYFRYSQEAFKQILLKEFQDVHATEHHVNQSVVGWGRKPL